jgi:mannose-6-phosphate isomerase-like protein (cupin superfamily)
VDLEVAIAQYAERGFKLDMIMPADLPRLAIVSKDGVVVQLVGRETAAVPESVALGQDGQREPLISRANDAQGTRGRAGMEYRDLIPGRIGGRVIASHIRVPGGGLVPDSVHYHNVRFQMIYCRRGWVRVVYEDQGPPFVMREGDCVLQPPTIRHRVLESSPGLEVIEIASPAEHETWHDHTLSLPTPKLRRDRLFGDQPFVRDVAERASWKIEANGSTARDLGISRATGGLASARVLRLEAEGKAVRLKHQGNDRRIFLAITRGKVRLADNLGAQTLETDDACVLPPNSDYTLEGLSPCEILVVTLPPW